jgi:cell wall-associated NlpC family hydrolase
LKPTRAQFVIKLCGLIDTPYIYGGRGDKGVDCWGLGALAYQKCGGGNVLFPWWTDKAWDELMIVERETSMEVGDCCFYGAPGDPNHVVFWMPRGAVLSASRGGSDVTTLEMAEKRRAKVMLQDHYRYRPDFTGFRSMSTLLR